MKVETKEKKEVDKLKSKTKYVEPVSDISQVNLDHIEAMIMNATNKRKKLEKGCNP